MFGSPLLCMYHVHVQRNWVWSTQDHCSLQVARPTSLEAHYCYETGTHTMGKWVWSTQPHCSLQIVRPTGLEAHYCCETGTRTWENGCGVPMGVEYPTPLSVTKGEANRSGGPPRMRTPYTCNGKGVKSTHSHCLLQMVRPRGLAAHHRYALHTRTTGKWVWSTHGCGVPNPIAQ
jgi:hypothetical protein